MIHGRRNGNRHIACQAQGGQQINVLAFNQDKVLTNLPISYYTETDFLPPGEWLQVRIPVEDLNPRYLPVTHFVIENHSGDAASVFYVDDIRLVAAKP